MSQSSIKQPHFYTLQNTKKSCGTRYLGNNLWSGRPSIVHKALNIQEVLSLIFSFIHPQCMNPEFNDNERKKILRTLARAARTCKAFQLHASTLLWQEQHGLDAFSTMFERLSGEEDCPQYLLSLGERVKRLLYAGSKSEDDIRTVTLISKEIQGKPLFPNLQYLQLDSGSWPLTPTEASLLFSPGLLSFNITAPSQRRFHPPNGQWGRLSDTQHQQICIHKLIKRSPRLQVFRSLTTHVMPAKYISERGDRPGRFLGPYRITSIVTLRFNHPGRTVASKQEKLIRASQDPSSLDLDQCRQLFSTPSLIESQDIECLTLSTTTCTSLSVSKVLHLLHPFYHINSKKNVDIRIQCAALPEALSHYWQDLQESTADARSSMESFENALLLQAPDSIRPLSALSQRVSTQNCCRVHNFVTSLNRLLRQTTLLYSILHTFMKITLGPGSRRGLTRWQAWDNCRRDKRKCNCTEPCLMTADRGWNGGTAARERRASEERASEHTKRTGVHGRSSKADLYIG
ncbi:hypothetical protein QCA50_010704 [Cerrena zonata]|uniref:Uncharacterized protein n=1 Tax=Cerrena zonata TaxID=2478898 RepID=A0AAW0G0J2_9APHY